MTKTTLAKNKLFNTETIKVLTRDKDCLVNTSMDAAMEMIKSQCSGMRCIGSGSYGLVYGHPSMDIVYKVGLVKENEGYLVFVKTLQKQEKHNPFTPKIYGIRYYKNGNANEDVFVVAMERLQPSNSKKIARWFRENVDDIRNPIKDIPFPDLGVKLIIPDELREFLDILHTAYKAGNYSISYDFCTSNFMYRGKQLVCIDPLC
jgi:hypothetical protein